MPPGQGRDLQLPAGAADHRPGRRRLAGHLVAGRRGGEPSHRPDHAGARAGRADARASRGHQLGPAAALIIRTALYAVFFRTIPGFTFVPPGGSPWMPAQPGPRGSVRWSAVMRSPPTRATGP